MHGSVKQGARGILRTICTDSCDNHGHNQSCHAAVLHQHFSLLPAEQCTDQHTCSTTYTRASLPAPDMRQTANAVTSISLLAILSVSMLESYHVGSNAEGEGRVVCRGGSGEEREIVLVVQQERRAQGQEEEGVLGGGAVMVVQRKGDQLSRWSKGCKGKLVWCSGQGGP